MEIMSVTSAKARLNELVDDAAETQQRVMITKNGRPAAVMISADDWASIEETLFWSAQAGALDEVRNADRELDEGSTVSLDRLPRFRSA